MGGDNGEGGDFGAMGWLFESTWSCGTRSSGLLPRIRAANTIRQLVQDCDEEVADVLRWGRASLQNTAGSTKLPANSALAITWENINPVITSQ